MILEHKLQKKNLSLVPAAKITTILTLEQVNLHNYTFPVKLDQTNYMIWKSQIFPMIIGGNLEDFVTGNIAEPPKYIPYFSTSNTKTNPMVPNPSYTLWRHIDQVLLEWV